MQSKEEIENKLEQTEDDEITINLLYEEVELLKTEINKLETDKQKLIEKLEKDIEITKKQYTENTLLNIRVDGKLDTLEEILKILKGGNDEYRKI